MPVATVNGADVAYVDTAAQDVPVLVLLHAFPFDSRMWEAQLEALAGAARVIAPDLQGFGKSDVPEDPLAYSVDAYADDVRALLAELEIPRAVIGGLSMGGYVALSLAARYPDAVQGLLLADTRPEADPPERREQRSDQQRRVREGGTEAVVDELLGRLLGDTTRRERPEVVARVRALMQQPAAGVVGALEALKNRPDRTGALAAMDVPALVVVGDEDELSPPDVGAAMAERLPQGDVVVLPGAGHLSNVEVPGPFTDAVLALLDRL